MPPKHNEFEKSARQKKNRRQRELEEQDVVEKSDDERPVKKSDFIQALAEATDRKPGELRDLLDTTFSMIGEYIEEGRSMNLAPLGKIKPVRQRDQEDKVIHVVKIMRQVADID